MKTAISLPDKVYESAEQTARRLGFSRSQLYVAALTSFLEKYQDERVTERLDRIYGEADSRLDEAFQSIQARTLRRNLW
ncbi:MAG: ChpI protein [Elusimicrobia bacterium]|nr:ChpI protein [Elusimicrobiota bacterium]